VRPDGELAALRASVATMVGSDVPFFLVGGAALVEGRGERVQPLSPINGTAPGVLLVTPAVAAATLAVFAAHDGGGITAPADPRATRLTSEHLASELRAGLSAASLLARAGVLASANDLAPAAGVVVPGLTILRRALARLLGRPVGVSGSGPTLWVLYPSGAAAATAAAEIRDGIAEGSIVAPGDRAPHIIASSIAAGGPDGASSPATRHAAEGRT
jgi:4-diphosphocytidyl-2-C-methyl-D-erythritol kinase